MTDAEICLFDIFLLIRKDMTGMIDRCKKLGLKIIFDIDDYWQLDQSHLLYHRYKELKMVQNMTDCIRKADLVTTTQQYLADKIKPFNTNVHVIPNIIQSGHKQWREPSPRSWDKVRIGWIGGVHHIEDVKLLRDCFQKLWNDDSINDKFQFVLGGYQSDSDVHKFFISIFSANQNPKALNNMILLPAMNVFEFATMYDLCDIILAPLVDSEFNRCKSNLKVVEAGWKGKPVIASNVYPYATTIKHNQTGFLIDNHRGHKDWYKAIKHLITNDVERNRLANNLQLEIKSIFDANNYNEYIVNLYQCVIQQPVN
jgi:glycosyltransferase involved in cell wall biosynthesis